MEQLVEKTRSLGRQATFKDVKDDATMAPPNDYAFYHGSFDDAAEIAWRTVKAEKEKKKEVDKKMSEHEKRGRKEWLEWLFEVGGEKLPMWPSFKREYEAEAAEILAAFGEWRVVEGLFAEYLKDREKATAEPEEESETESEESKPKNVTEGKIQADPVIEYSKLVLRIQKDLGLKDRLPSQKEINQYAQTYGVAYYTTIAKHLGLKSEWPEVIAKALDIKMSDVIQYTGPLEPAPAPVKPVETTPIEPVKSPVVAAPVALPPTEAPTSVASALARIFGVGAVDLVSMDLIITEPNGKYSLKMQKLE
ncbi:MAG: hypothetical protein Q4B29_03160 [Candidatus Saccharibacteria bacterium]|nr:hypothetical protein [Candidatus Saccharibacteria bacterium]